MKNFFKVFINSLDGITNTDAIKNICEIGCGEGELLKILNKKFPFANLFACDLSLEEIEKAKNSCASLDVQFSVQNAQDLKEYFNNQFDLVICVEVLEHLQVPYLGLQELERISSNYLLVSVPNEPIWRILNMLRGKYLKHFGNTPGHINHWSIFKFKKFLSQGKTLKIKNQNYPFPWQMKLIVKKKK